MAEGGCTPRLCIPTFPQYQASHNHIRPAGLVAMRAAWRNAGLVVQCWPAGAMQTDRWPCGPPGGNADRLLAMLACWYVLGAMLACWYVLGAMLACWYVLGAKEWPSLCDLAICCVLFVCWAKPDSPTRGEFRLYSNLPVSGLYLRRLAGLK